jgi:hypothetical protein
MHGARLPDDEPLACLPASTDDGVMMSSWCLVLVAVVALGGCKKGPGDSCEGDDQCKDGLTCANWSDAHEDVIGKCGGDRCCASRDESDEATRRSECEALIAAIDATRDVAGLNWKKPDDLKELARKLNGHVKAYEGVAVTDAALEVAKDDYVQMARELAESADKRALGVNQFDGPVVFGETKRMKKIGKREVVVAKKLNGTCKGSKPLRPVLSEGGTGIAK